MWCDQKLHNCRLNEWIQNLRQGRRVNVCNRAAAVLERISNKYTVKASISVIGQRGSFVLTVSRCDTVAILSSRQTSMVGLSSLPLCYHLIWPAVPGTPLAPVPMLVMTTPLHICQRSKPTLKTGREGVLLKPTGVPPVLLVIFHCHVAAVQAATYRRHSSGLAVLSWKQNMSWNLKSMQCFTNNTIKKNMWELQFCLPSFSFFLCWAKSMVCFRNPFQTASAKRNVLMLKCWALLID